MPLDIRDYALIGDCETAALVGHDGSIDWLCWPRFDSDACFAALLGDADNGRWLICPADSPFTVTRTYRDRTLILDTRFEASSGVVTVTDFMPPRGGASDLIRQVTCDRGRVRLKMELVLRFGYGTVVPWVSKVDRRTIHAIAGPNLIVAHSDVDMHREDSKMVADFELHAGQSAFFSLTYQASHLELPPPPAVEDALEKTGTFWREWIGKATGAATWTEPVIRSLITLRALIYAPTGGIVAAPTTSLPEHIGGRRNWDYRFCWLRDATMTLLSLMNSGHLREAEAWRDWLIRAVAGSPKQLQIMYGLAGERRLWEWEVSWLPGYRNSHPVRVGNAAHSQLQLDVYGEVVDVLYQARRGGIQGTAATWSLQKALLSHLETVWREPDAGLWEMRGPPRQFVHSKVMAWLAFERAIASAEEFSLSGPIERWREIRSLIHEEVCTRGFNPEIGSFVQSFGTKDLDASLLLLPSVGFVAASDPRFVGTVSAIERHLLKDGFVLRYLTDDSLDGLPPGEGVFLACSFWLVDAYAMMGDVGKAHALFQRLLTLRNDVGLLSEEYDPVSGHLLGNFPQAFSHVALIDSAHNLFHALKPTRQRASHSAHRID